MAEGTIKYIERDSYIPETSDVMLIYRCLLSRNKQTDPGKLLYVVLVMTTRLVIEVDRTLPGQFQTDGSSGLQAIVQRLFQRTCMHVTSLVRTIMSRWKECKTGDAIRGPTDELSYPPAEHKNPSSTTRNSSITADTPTIQELPTSIIRL